MATTARMGGFDLMVLAAVFWAGKDAYGVRLCDEIYQRTGRAVSVGAMYTTLYRLERKGLVVSRVGEPSAERGGRAKRFFSLTPRGRKAIRESLAMLGGMTDGLLARLPTT